jgi:riboflavin biosynthesis pyrimidine reductase
LFLTLSPRLLGGDPQKIATLVDGEELAPPAPQLELLCVYLAESELFLRYALNHP